MGTVKDLWDWKPLSIEQKLHLETLAPDHRIGRAAAIEYLDRHREPEPVVFTSLNYVIVPVAVCLILVALIGLTAGWAFR